MDGSPTSGEAWNLTDLKIKNMVEFLIPYYLLFSETGAYKLGGFSLLTRLPLQGSKFYNLRWYLSPAWPRALLMWNLLYSGSLDGGN